MEDRCICCGEIIPEGGWVCISCLLKADKEDNNENNKIS